MSAQALIDKLEGVKKTGHRRWIARCPGHDDNTPSLAIKETDDGRTLLHDFGGCDTQAVLLALGMTFDDLFPERVAHFKPMRRSFPAQDILNCIAREAMVVWLFACDLSNGASLDAAGKERLALAVSRLQMACEVPNA